MAAKGHDGHLDGSSRSALHQGDRIVVYGLTGRPELNGLTGTLLEHDPVMHRWRVELDDGAKKIFKDANLALFDADYDDDLAEVPGFSSGAAGVADAGTGRAAATAAGANGGRGGGYSGYPAAAAAVPPAAPAPAPAPAADRDRPSPFGGARAPTMADRDRIPPEMLHEVLGLDSAAPAAVAAAAVGPAPAPMGEELGSAATPSPTGQARGGESPTLARLEDQLRLAVARIAKLEERQGAAEEVLRDRVARAEAAARPEGAALSGADLDARLRREASRLDEVVSQLRALEGCLVEGGALSATTVQNKILRERFEVIRQRSGWRATATLKEVAAERGVAECLGALAGGTALAALHTALGPHGQTASNRRIRVAGQLRQLCDAVGASPTPAAIRALREVATRAEHLDVEPGQIAAAHTALQRGRALSAVLASASQEELERAVQAAERTGIDADELTQLARTSQDRIAEAQRKAAAQRRLRSAISWATREKTDSLRRAIAEAQEVGLEHAEVQKAVDVLESYTKGSDAQHSTSLSAFLRQAKPNWSAQSLEAALTKLACVGIARVPDLHEALTHPDDHHLNERLRASEQKVFADETLKAFRNNLRQLS